MDDWDGLAPIADEAWYSTKGQRRKTLVATVLAAGLLTVFWFLLLVAYASSFPAPPADESPEEHLERIIEYSVGWREWLALVVGIALWPVAALIASRIVGLVGIGPRFVVAVGCLVLVALLLFGFLMLIAG